MTKTESVYFDLTRVVAALFVLVGHVVLIVPGALPFQDWAHFAVICFFVLSGYVISYVSDGKEKSGIDYFINRAARVYSVAFPAVLLTVGCDYFGRQSLGSTIYQFHPHDWALLRIALALTFTSETWFNSVQLLSNGPYWSLCYEVWYYAIFGAAYYLKGRRRGLTVAALTILAGPKILLLFPIWLLGVALYRYKNIPRPSVGFALFIISIVSIVIIVHSDLPTAALRMVRHVVGAEIFKDLEFSGDFPSDYLVALLVAINFFAVRSFDGKIDLSRIAGPIRWAGASTFSLYLFHFPLMLLLMSVFPSLRVSGNALVLIASILILVVLLSYATERRKTFWRKAVVLTVSIARNYRPFAPPAYDGDGSKI